MNKVLTVVTVLVLLAGCQVAKQEQSLEDQLKKIMVEAETAAKKGDRKLVISKTKEYKQLVKEESSNKEAELLAVEAKVLFSQQRFDQAEKSLEKALELDPDNQDYVQLLTKTKKAKNQAEKVL